MYQNMATYITDHQKKGDQLMASYGRLEEALRKHDPKNLESGIEQASLMIDTGVDDARLYLLRAKLLYKLLLIRQQQKVKERIRNCLGDCEQAIAIIERGVERGDVVTVKKHALQLGYLCCERLKDVQKEKEIQYRMLELNIKCPIAKNTINQLLFISPDQVGQNCTYDLKELVFPNASFIDTPLLEDVIRCYKDRQTVCRNCFCNDLKLSRGYDAKGKCTQCQWEFKKLLVIPKSPMTVNYYKSEMIAIPPWPKSKPNELPFESCAKPTDKSQDHKRCLIMSRNSAVWYAHTVEELVIWTVERERGCTFGDFIRSYEPVSAVTNPYQPPLLYDNPVDFQVPTVYYNPAAPMPFNQIGLVQPFSIASPSFFVPPTAAVVYSDDEFISPPALYSTPTPPTPLLAPAELLDDKIVKRFEKFTCSSPPSSPPATDDVEQPVTSSNTIEKNNTVSGKLFLLSKTKFTSAERIPQHLLESVSTCYSQKIQACTWCFLTHLPSTRKQLQSMAVADTGICRKCLRNNGAIAVIPASDLCEASCYGNFVAIPPTPNHANNIRAFQYCKKYEKPSDHKKCLLLTRRGNAWFPHSVEEMVIWTIEYKTGIPFDTVYREHCRVVCPSIIPSDNNDEQQQQQNNQLYCGYCNIHCKTVDNFVTHCKQNLHVDAVFADSGRNVFWKFEPPPTKEYIYTASFEFDKLREWRTRLNRRRSNKAKEIPFGLRDQLVEQELTEAIIGLETKLKCFCYTANASHVLAAEGAKITWTLLIKGNQHHSFRGVRLHEKSVFKLAQVFHCTTKQNYTIENNMCCSPDNRPGLLLGLVKVDFWAAPKKCDEYKDKILIDVGLSKCLSVPVELIVVIPKLYKLNKWLQSGKLLLGMQSIFSNSKLEIKEILSSISLDDKALIEKYNELLQLKQSDLYSNNCATLLESTDKKLYYEKLCTLLYLEGDYRRRLIQRVSKTEILAKLTFIKGPPSLEVGLEDLGDAELAECSILLKNSPFVRLRFLSDDIGAGAPSYIWECNKEITEDVLLIKLPPSFPMLPKVKQDGENFSIAFEFAEDFTYLAQCHAAVEYFKRRKLDYLLFPSNQTYYPNTKSFTCKSPLKKCDTELNPQQVSAMEAILLSESVLPVIIAGPFGTGKTFLLAQAAEYLVNYSKHCHILICTLTNSAANVYLEYFHKRIPFDHDWKILRLVYKGQMVVRVPRHLHKYCLFESSNHQRFCYPLESDARQYHIIVTTVISSRELLKLNMTGQFTHIFIDEAAQMIVPAVAMALSLASNTTKVVLAGDHMQIDPEVYSPLAKEYDFHKSPLELIYSEYSELRHSKHKILLAHNYRTHSEILKLPSKFFYRDKLRSCDTIEKHPDYKALILLKPTDKDNYEETYSPEYLTYFNDKEGDKIVAFLKDLLPKWPAEWGQLKDSTNNIGILTTEYAQVRYIRSCLKRERIQNIFVDTIASAQGLEFRVVILSIVRTRHSINKDSVHKCGFYTDKRVLNTAFTRVQSLIVTAAHPLSLITRGHMTCRLFWASYLSESLSDEDLNQLRKEFVSECQVGLVAKHWQLSPEDYELYSILVKDQAHAIGHDPTGDRGYYDQILCDLEKQFIKDNEEQQNSQSAGDSLDNVSYHGQIISDLERDFDYDSHQDRYLTTKTEVQASIPQMSFSNVDNIPSSTNAVAGRTTGPGNVSLSTVASVSNRLHSNAGNHASIGSSSIRSRNSGPKGTNRSSFKVGDHRAYVDGLHSPYITLPHNHNRQLFMLTVIKGAESGYALTLDPKERDIWLSDSSALNRSLRGDTVALDLLGSRNNKGKVVANISSKNYNYPKEFFICRTDRHTYNLLVPIDKQYPKIDTCQKVAQDGLSIFAGRLYNSTACNIKLKDVGKNVYLVRLDHPWTAGHVYPKGVPVKRIKLEDDVTTFLNILKFNYIPSMPTNDGKFSPHVLNEAMQEYPRDWEIPHKEKKKRKFYKDVFTIDDEETVVLDDALSLEFDGDHNYVVNIHIADGSYFVKPGSALDRAASERGRTFYINYEDDGAMFMLPDNICMEHGSLQVGKERLAVTTQFVFSKDEYSLIGEMSDVEVHRSIVCSTYRLTKEDAGRFLLDRSMTQLKDMSPNLFNKMKKDLSILRKIADELRKSRWPDSYLYERDRGKQDKYSLAGSSLVEMFMCLCNTAIPAKLLKRDGQVGPVLVHEPIKHHKQHEWLERHYHLLNCCPVFKRMISDEALKSFNDKQQNSTGAVAQGDNVTANNIDNQGTTKFIKVSKENWDRISSLASKHNSSDLASFLCSLHHFPELYVAYRQLCMSQSRSFYHVIDNANAAQSSKYKHSEFNKVYTHFTSPLRRYCDIVVHRAVLSKKPSLPSMELIHRMNIHKWDERDFSKQRNMLYITDCCRRETGAIAMTAYVGKFTNKVVELHALPELQEILPDRICEMKLSHLQAKCDTESVHLLKWNVEIIPAPNNRSSKKEINISEDYDLVEISLDTIGASIEALHNPKFKEGDVKKKIKACKIVCSKFRDVEQEVKSSSHKLTITKCIREYSKLDIQLSSSQAKSYAIEPTVSLVHISRTFSCCLLHVKSPIQCFAPNISKSTSLWLPTAHKISDYVQSWQPAIEAESITNSTTSSRVPVIIKDLKLEWSSPREAQFPISADYRVKYHRPFDYGDYVCIQYRNLLLNPKSQYFELDESKKVTWVAHGRINGKVSDDEEENVKMIFPENTILPEAPIFGKLCYLEIIPLQITFKRIKVMFDHIKCTNNTLVKKICCRDYHKQIKTPEINEDEDQELNEGQRRAIETALIPDNELLLVQGPPGTGKSKVCVEMIKRFVEHNYEDIHSEDGAHSDKEAYNDNKTSSRGPTIIYCAPSNKAVNVGASKMLDKYPDVHIVRVYGTIIEDKKFPGLNKIPSLAKRVVSFRNEDFSTVPENLETHSLHFKIRDKDSTSPEIKEFIKYENQILSEQFLKMLQEEEDYIKLEQIRKEYTAIKHKAERAALRMAKVVFCTCSETGSKRIEKCIGQAEQCIIDECGMCIEPETLLPMILAKKIILVGDHKQLQPVVLNKTAKSLGLQISLFQRLFEDEKMSRYCIMLTEQYRMHSSICDFPSNQFYGGELVAAEVVQKRRWPGRLPFNVWKQPQTQRCVFIHVEGTEDVSGIDAKGSYEESKFNEMEADEVMNIINELIRNKIPEKDIMVLTPYRAHKDHIRESLPEKSKVEVSTVHESQGRECDVVILTTARSLPKEDIPDRPSQSWINKNLGFVTDEHLMNVAITRAKEAFCIIGNRHLLNKHRMWKDMLQFYAEDDCIIQSYKNGYELMC